MDREVRRRSVPTAPALPCQRGGGRRRIRSPYQYTSGTVNEPAEYVRHCQWTRGGGNAAAKSRRNRRRGGRAVWEGYRGRGVDSKAEPERAPAAGPVRRSAEFVRRGDVRGTEDSSRRRLASYGFGHVLGPRGGAVLCLHGPLRPARRLGRLGVGRRLRNRGRRGLSAGGDDAEPDKSRGGFRPRPGGHLPPHPQPDVLRHAARVDGLGVVARPLALLGPRLGLRLVHEPFSNRGGGADFGRKIWRGLRAIQGGSPKMALGAAIRLDKGASSRYDFL